MGINHYFSNKLALLEALCISLIEEIHEPKAGGKWQDELEQLRKSYLELWGVQPSVLDYHP